MESRKWELYWGHLKLQKRTFCAFSSPARQTHKSASRPQLSRSGGKYPREEYFIDHAFAHCLCEALPAPLFRVSGLRGGRGASAQCRGPCGRRLQQSTSGALHEQNILFEAWARRASTSPAWDKTSPLGSPAQKSSINHPKPQTSGTQSHSPPWSFSDREVRKQTAVKKAVLKRIAERAETVAVVQSSM